MKIVLAVPIFLTCEYDMKYGREDETYIVDQYTLKQLDNFCEYVFGINVLDGKTNAGKGRGLLKNQNVNKLNSCYKETGAVLWY